MRADVSRGSRRQFLFACTAVTAMSQIAGPQRKPRVVVVGAGVFGGWIALRLQRGGAQTTLVDAWGPGNARSSSGGETRISRATYGGSELYTRMSVESLQVWQQEQTAWNQPLFVRTGALWMTGPDDAYERDALAVLSRAGVAFERLSPEDCRRRWPQIDFTGISWAIYEQEAGFLLARRACAAIMHAVVHEGGSYRLAQAAPGVMSGRAMQHVVLNGTDRIEADAFVFACGPWLPRLFPFLAASLRPTRQDVFFFGTPAGDQQFTETRLPIWIDHGPRFIYGIPGNESRGFKIADDTRGGEFDPTDGDRRVSEAGLQAMRDYLSRRFPGLRQAPLVESRVCQYENSTDQDFIVDRHPEAANVWIVGGGSGHGFKHGPAVGDIVARAILEREGPPSAFRLDRPGLARSPR